MKVILNDYIEHLGERGDSVVVKRVKFSLNTTPAISGSLSITGVGMSLFTSTLRGVEFPHAAVSSAAMTTTNP